MKKREAEAREKIIAAATDLISEQGGAQEVTTRDVAARAGVGVGLVNYHFQTKEHLFELCVRRIVDAAVMDLEAERLGQGAEPVEKLRTLLKGIARFLAKNPGVCRTSVSSDLLSPAAQDGTSRMLEACLPAVREVCAGKATQTEMLLLPHLMLSSLQTAFLRGAAFAGYAGFDFMSDASRDQLVDVLVYVVFRKYM